MQVSSYLDGGGDLRMILIIDHSELIGTEVFILKIGHTTKPPSIKSVTKVTSLRSGVEVVLPEQEDDVTIFVAKKMPTGNVKIYSLPLSGKLSFVVCIIEEGRINGGSSASWFQGFEKELKKALGVA